MDALMSVHVLKSEDAGFNHNDLVNLSQIANIGSDIDESQACIAGLNRQGQSIRLSGHTPPAGFTLVISESVEHLAIHPLTYESPSGLVYPQSKLITPLFKTKHWNYYTTADIYGRPELKIDLRVTNQECERDTQDGAEELASVAWTSCSNYLRLCGWWEKNCCLRAYVVMGINIRGGGFAFDAQRVDLKPLPHRQYILTNLFGCREPKTVQNPTLSATSMGLFNWDPATMATPVKYVWFEVDGAEQNVNIYTSWVVHAVHDSLGQSQVVGGYVQVNSKDDALGESVVDYCEPVGIMQPSMTDNTGSIIFTLRN